MKSDLNFRYAKTINILYALIQVQKILFEKLMSSTPEEQEVNYSNLLTSVEEYNYYMGILRTHYKIQLSEK